MIRQDTKRIRPCEGHSRARDSGARVLSGLGTGMRTVRETTKSELKKRMPLNERATDNTNVTKH